MIKVTEEMVEAGLQHYSEGGCSGLADYERKEVVRYILEAALSAPAEPVGVGEPDPSAMRVIDPDQWEPCSPSWLSRGGNCACAPRVWNVKDRNHWHPKLSAVEHVAAPTDTELLNALAANYWDLRCISVPTGGDDYDVDWAVIEHPQAKPHERTVAQGYTDDPRVAIRRAIRETDPKAERCVSCDEVLHDGESVFYEHGEGGHIHSWCASDDATDFVDEDEVPLQPGSELPKPFAYRLDRAALTPQSGAGTHSPVQHVELIAKLRTLTSNTGRDHRTGEEFVHGAGSQEVVDALRSALAALQGIPPVQHVAGGRWRVFEAATERGWWGIELEEAGNDDDPILYPVKIGRNRLDALVAAHNDAIASDGAEACAGEHQVVLDAIQSHNSGEDE